MSPYEAINQIFAAASAKSGNVVRRSKANIDKDELFSYLLKEVQSRGFHLLETGDQYVIICNTGHIKVHC
jgi:hypothetical protein